MKFWDRLMVALARLAECSANGPASALRLLALMRERPGLTLEELSDCSCLLLLTFLNEEHDWLDLVNQRLRQAQLAQNPTLLLQLLRNATQPRLTELLTMARLSGYRGYGNVLLGQAIVSPEVGIYDNLRLFLGRMSLSDPGSPRVRSRATAALNQALAVVLQNGDDFLGTFYRTVRVVTEPGLDEVLPAFQGNTRPPWFVQMSLEEQHFVEECQNLTEPNLPVIYLHFYSLLTVEQIRAALSDPPPEPEDMVARLEENWAQILFGMGS